VKKKNLRTQRVIVAEVVAVVLVEVVVELVATSAAAVVTSKWAEIPKAMAPAMAH
jgi:hypothetical protein